MKRILYVQYTNPAAYPPLEHSSRILADEGWKVLFLGTGALGADSFRFRPHPRIRVKRMRFVPGGLLQKFHYAGFCVWVLGWSLCWRPDWIYASDPLSCPISCMLSSVGARVIYHEHDSPEPGENNLWGRWIARFRKRLARRARLCVLPNQERAERFQEETGQSSIACVWNCPQRSEASPPRLPMKEGLRVLYFGSVVPARLPFPLLEALRLLPGAVRLQIVGYETIGYPGYGRHFKEKADELGLSGRVEWMGAVATREQLLEIAGDCDVGLCLLGESSLLGASNKPFDYMARGLALLVADSPGWKRMYAEPGYGLTVVPGDARSVAEALRWFHEHPEQTRAMGERGRQKVLSDWNYGLQFLPVFRWLRGEDP